MNVWVNDPNFKELGNERDPFVGTQDGTFDYTIPKRPIRKKLKGLPAFTTIRGGAYFFLPGLRALRFLAAGCPGCTAGFAKNGRTAMTQIKNRPRTYNQVQVPRKYTPGKPRFSIYWTWSYPWESNRDLTEMDNRFSSITEVRRVAWPKYETTEFSQQMFLQGIAGTLELFHLSLLRFQNLAWRDHRSSRRRLPAHRPGGTETPYRRAHPRRYRYS